MVGGLSKLLNECCKLLSSAGVQVDSSDGFIRDVFSTFLFPPLSDPSMLLDETLTPVLDANVRESLYDLVLALTPGNLEDVAIELENDLVQKGS